MRGLALFVAGTLVGLAATSMAQSQGPNEGIVEINRVTLAVPDIEKAIEHYTKVMGFPRRSGSGIRRARSSWSTSRSARTPSSSCRPSVPSAPPASIASAWWSRTWRRHMPRGRRAAPTCARSRRASAPRPSCRTSTIRMASGWSYCNCRRTRCTPRRASAGSSELDIGLAQHPAPLLHRGRRRTVAS